MLNGAQALEKPKPPRGLTMRGDSLMALECEVYSHTQKQEVKIDECPPSPNSARETLRDGATILTRMPSCVSKDAIPCTEHYRTERFWGIVSARQAVELSRNPLRINQFQLGFLNGIAVALRVGARVAGKSAPKFGYPGDRGFTNSCHIRIEVSHGLRSSGVRRPTEGHAWNFTPFLVGNWNGLASGGWYLA